MVFIALHRIPSVHAPPLPHPPRTSHYYNPSFLSPFIIHLHILVRHHSIYSSHLVFPPIHISPYLTNIYGSSNAPFKAQSLPSQRSRYACHRFDLCLYLFCIVSRFWVEYSQLLPCSGPTSFPLNMSTDNPDAQMWITLPPSRQNELHLEA